MRKYSIFLSSIFAILVISQMVPNSVAHATEFDEPFVLLVEDQMIVDHKVLVTVNITHHGFVAIWNDTNGSPDKMIGHASTNLTSGHMDHSHLILSDGDGHMHTDVGIIPVHVMINHEAMTNTLYAQLFNDTNTNGMFDMGTDLSVKDDGEDVIESFKTSGMSPVTIEVEDQTIRSDGIVTVDRIVVTGPAWLVIHEKVESGLGPMWGRIDEPLVHGENLDLEVKINLTKLPEDVTEMEFYAHLHYDRGDLGIFNKGIDAHIFSPNFDDPVIGNESAIPFVATFDLDDSSPLPVMPFVASFSVLGILVILRKQR